MIEKNIEKQDRKSRRKPPLPAPKKEKTKNERITAVRKKYKKEDC